VIFHRADNCCTKAGAGGEALVGREDDEAEGGDRDHGRAEI
jgi:hypothetical protein